MNGHLIDGLSELRKHQDTTSAEGLPLDVIEHFAVQDPRLHRAVTRAVTVQRRLRRLNPDLLNTDERTLGQRVQSFVLNFYPADAVARFLPLAAEGPWVITLHGAVLHDSAGYGMLGLGHAPPQILEVLALPWPMANVMVPTLAQERFTRRLRTEIGHTRGASPYSRFAFLNSGSEAVTLAARLADTKARLLTESGSRHSGKRVATMSLEQSFHGRTYRPARVSHSTLPTYRRHLASFRRQDDLCTVPPNDAAALYRAFEEAESSGVYFEALFIEPVLGEGVPGLAITRPFYDLARELTRQAGTLLVVDSIQAGLRAHGCLSLVDQPGFEDCRPPDVEVWSKALNAGQFPLSVIGMTEETAQLYAQGTYGNTMTGNPRAMEVGCAVLDAVTPDLRENIRARGAELVRELEELGEEVPGSITGVTGTGLMVCAEMDPRRFPVGGEGGLEQTCRELGVMMIHGGRNGMRFTPCFDITSEEIAMMVDVLRQAMELVEMRRRVGHRGAAPDRHARP